MTARAVVGVALPAGDRPAPNIVTSTIELAREAQAVGLDAVWFSQRFDTDAITLAAVVGRAVPGLGVGTSVVPVHPRHPIVVANQALTAQAASEGRFTLGLGLGAPALVEQSSGIVPTRVIAHLREYLTVLHQIFDTGAADFVGEVITARTPLPAVVDGADPVPVLVAAMGPQGLRVAGELADGTLPFLAGPRTLSEFVVPRITEAARAAGRPEPRIVVALPAIVTDDVDATRAAARVEMEFYNDIPSYRAIMEREGVDHPSDLAIIGDEQNLADAVARYRDAGATELVLTQTGLAGEQDRVRTWQVAGTLTG